MNIAFVPCRLKSTRFPNKGITPIYGISAIERCLLNATSIKGVDKVILATSTAHEDDVLTEYNLQGKIEVVRGSEDDVLGRFMPSIKKYNPKHILRITGDCPLVSPELAEILINEHIKSNADATFTNSKVALGIACEVYKTDAIYKLRELFPFTNHSEYLIYYFTNNQDYFKLNPIISPEVFCKNWRLTFDESRDLILLEKIYSELNVKYRYVAFNELISFFDKYPEAVQINSDILVKYRDNKGLIAYLKNETTYQKLS